MKENTNIYEGLQEFRIFGSPGTGKTTTLTAQIQADAETYGEEAVLACTLTNTAATELAGRNLTIGQCGTLHSICYRLLGCPPVADDKKLLVEWNESHPQYQLSITGSQDIDDGGATPKANVTEADRLYQSYQVRRAKMKERTTWPLPLIEFAEQWESWKQKKGAVDFSDMIEIPYREQMGPPEGIEVAFMDEAQDMDLLSLSLFRQWGKELAHIVLAGDDDQAIYSFRGSTPEALLEYPIPEDHINIRPQSYRVPRAVHAAAVAWVEQLSFRQPKTYLPRPEDGEVRVYNGADIEDPAPLLPEIEEALAKGKTVMVLAACGYMLKPLIHTLKSVGLPFHNPWRTKRGDWNPLGFHRVGVTARDRLLAFLSPDPNRQGTTRLLWTANEIREWTDPLRVDGVLQRGQRTVLEKLEGNAEVTLQDLQTWFQAAAIPSATALDLDWFASSLLSSKRSVYQYPIAVVERQSTQALIDAPKLTLGTIHSVKGGESDVVILFPDLPWAAAEWWESGDRDAVIRQFYVGMTRARETLIVCRAASDLAVEGLL